jgi:hypothetical protein
MPSNASVNASLMSKIDIVINETAQFLSQYLGGMERFEERFQAAQDFLKDAGEDIKLPSTTYRPFSEFHPL